MEDYVENLFRKFSTGTNDLWPAELDSPPTLKADCRHGPLAR